MQLLICKWHFLFMSLIMPFELVLCNTCVLRQYIKSTSFFNITHPSSTSVFHFYSLNMFWKQELFLITSSCTLCNWSMIFSFVVINRRLVISFLVLNRLGWIVDHTLNDHDRVVVRIIMFSLAFWKLLVEWNDVLAARRKWMCPSEIISPRTVTAVLFSQVII